MPSTAWFEPKYQSLAKKAALLQQSGHLSEAASLFRSGLEDARREGDTRVQSRLLNNLASLRLSVTDYRAATNAYLEALRLAEQDHDQNVLRSIFLNLSSVYLNQGDLESASALASKAESNLTGGETATYSVGVFLQFARIQSRKGDWQGAEVYFHRAIAKAALHGEAVVEALAWDNLGYERMQRTDLEGAESALTEAFRLRRQTKSGQVCLSYINLGELRYWQDRYAEADGWLRRAAGCKSMRLLPIHHWPILHYRAKVAEALGQNAQALVDMRAAIEYARSWKLDIIPVDGLRTAAETELQDLYDSYINVAAGEALRTGNQSGLVWESFLTAQENHAWSFRQLKRQSQIQLPEAYFNTLEKLRQVEGNAVFNPTSSITDVAPLRLTLRNLELEAGLTSPATVPQNSSFAQKQALAALQPNQALISFHCAPERTLVWVLTREGISLKQLPNQSVIYEQLQAYLSAIRNQQNEPNQQDKPNLQNEANLMHRAQQLSASLLSQVEPLARHKKEWLLILDRKLFSVPFAALPIDSAGTYLIEKHSLRVLPSFLLPSYNGPGATHGLLGFGDPIYNRADERLSNSNQFPVSETQLTRLPNSTRELEQTANALRPLGPPRLFTGGSASFASVRDAMSAHPKVIHFAGHFVKNGKSSDAALALSLTRQGYPELMTAADVATLNTDADLVTLSGCSSGSGASLPGTGLMGLTRAWLAAGAGSTIASQWPTPDDNGEIFVKLYAQLAKSSGRLTPSQVAEALRQAQLASIRSNTFRNRPRYWAAFFLVGKG